MASVITQSVPVGVPPRHSRPPRRRLAPFVVLAAVVAAAATAVLVATRGSDAPGPPRSVGITEDLAVPASVLRIPLVDEHGRTTSLEAFRGKIVVLASFLTSCQETCPLTTGAFLDMQRAVGSAGLGRKVVFIEASVDPGRDTPSRLAAYARVTGATWPLLTATPAHVAALWRSFGIYYQAVPEDNPPGIDWLTGKPYTYDINHSDGFLVFDRQLHERFVTGAAPNLRSGTLSGTLERMLNAKGRKNLFHPGGGTWTVPEGLQAIGWVAGRSVPLPS